MDLAEAEERFSEIRYFFEVTGAFAMVGEVVAGMAPVFILVA